MSTYTKTCARGEVFNWTARFYNTDRTPYDLTDKTVKFRIGVEGGATLLEVSGTVASPTSGVATGSLTSVQTAALAVGTHDFHIAVYLTAGTSPLFRPITGTFTIEAVVGGTL